MDIADTICALATPQGNGSVSIVRLSGPYALDIAKSVTCHNLKPRYAHFVSFFSQDDTAIDQGVAIYFPQPNSYTGENVVEFQSHGSPFVTQRLLSELCKHGARLAIAGEFSERAFLNGKLDLSQLEAIADLIASGSEQAARSAVLSMQGKFSQQVQTILQQLIHIRTHIEATLDFAEEDIEVEVKTQMRSNLAETKETIEQLFAVAQKGVQMQQGVSVVLTGQANVGKSSLLNALSTEERAIVTEIPGTTRDTVYVDMEIEGVPMRLIDTAGLRSDVGTVEQVGIARAHKAIENADLVVQVIDSNQLDTFDFAIGNSENLLKIYNKIDLVLDDSHIPAEAIRVSAKTGEGLDLLRTQISKCLNTQTHSSQTPFSARSRHLDAMCRALHAIDQALEQLQKNTPLELAAEELRIAQQCLGEITGEFTPDDLLDYVFREFCIGK